MVTLGGPDASCGPHFDHYDVFLFQLRGEKHWQWDALSHNDAELDLDAEIRLLCAFEPQFTQTMAAGDVLYIPPGAGHWGTAGPDSITLSIGIRNPTLMELVSSYTDELLDEGSLHDKGAATLDDLVDQTQTAVPTSVVDHLQASYVEFVSNRALMSRWFGCYMTELKEPDLITPMERSQVTSELADHRASKAPFRLTLATRMTYLHDTEPGQCFLNGQVLDIEAGMLPLIDLLLQNREVSASAVFKHEENVLLMETLMLNGAIQVTGATSAA